MFIKVKKLTLSLDITPLWFRMKRILYMLPIRYYDFFSDYILCCYSYDLLKYSLKSYKEFAGNSPSLQKINIFKRWRLWVKTALKHNRKYIFMYEGN